MKLKDMQCYSPQPFFTILKSPLESARGDKSSRHNSNSKSRLEKLISKYTACPKETPIIIEARRSKKHQHTKL